MVIKNALGNSMLFGWRIPILHRPADVIMMVAYAPAPNRHQAIPNHHADFQWLHNIILANIWYYAIYNNGITAIKQTILGRCGEIGNPLHYNDVIMSTMASQITSLTIVYSSVYSGADQRKHQSLASLAFVRGIHRSPMNSPHKGPVTRKMFPFDDIIIFFVTGRSTFHNDNGLFIKWRITQQDKHSLINRQLLAIQIKESMYYSTRID